MTLEDNHSIIRRLWSAAGGNESVKVDEEVLSRAIKSLSEFHERSRHKTSWRAEKSPAAGIIITDGNGNTFDENGHTVAFLDWDRAESFAAGINSGYDKINGRS